MIHFFPILSDRTPLMQWSALLKRLVALDSTYKHGRHGEIDQVLGIGKPRGYRGTPYSANLELDNRERLLKEVLAGCHVRRRVLNTILLMTVAQYASDSAIIAANVFQPRL
jgi:hypothetical protein